MVLDGAQLRDVEHRLRHEEGDIGHDAEVGRERFHQRRRLLGLPRRRLMQRQAFFQCELLQRIVGPALPVGGAEHADHLLAPLHELFEDRPAEGLLSVDDDAHRLTSLSLCRPGRHCR
jgi:hypothetical protein